MTSAKRTTFVGEIINEQPGPGNYNQTSTFGEGKGFQFGGRKQEKMNDNPGPGSYT